jgi:hypothetical protein
METYTQTIEESRDRYVNAAGVLKGTMQHLVMFKHIYSQNPEDMFSCIESVLKQVDEIIYND